MECHYKGAVVLPMTSKLRIVLKKRVMEIERWVFGLFLLIELNCFKVIDLLREVSLLLNTKSDGVPETHLIDVGRMKV